MRWSANSTTSAARRSASGAAPQPATDGGSAQPASSVDCTVDDPRPVEDDIDDGADKLVDELDTRVFVEANIEQQSDTKVTYLLHGTTVCQAGDFEQPDDLQHCIDEVDQLQIRLQVTSLAQGDVDIDVLVGPDRFNPVDFQLHHDLLASTVDLGELRSTAIFAGTITGSDLGDLPSTMRGVVRGELHHDGQRAKLTLSVLQNVVISDTNWQLHVDRAQPAASISADAAAQTVHALLDLNAIDLRAPITHTKYTYDEATGAESQTETRYDIAAHLGGASFDANYAAGDDRIDVHNAGLGNTTSTLDVNGKRVLAVDLNHTHGRKLDFTLTKGADGMDIAVDPAFDLEVLLQFARAQDTLENIADWTRDNLIHVTLDGAAHPAVRLGDSGLEVLAGQLHLSSTASGVDETVAAGQCVLAPDDSATMSGGGSASGGADVPPADDSNTSHDPFADLSVGACQ